MRRGWLSCGETAAKESEKIKKGLGEEE